MYSNRTELSHDCETSNFGKVRFQLYFSRHYGQGAAALTLRLRWQGFDPGQRSHNHDSQHYTQIDGPQPTPTPPASLATPLGAGRTQSGNH